jgi:polyphenol oxidase
VIPPVVARTQTRTAAPARKRDAGWQTLRTEGLDVLQARVLARLDWLVHGFSTKPGGVSEFAGARVLNLGYTEWDRRTNVQKNRARFQAALGAEAMRMTLVRQVHSDIVHEFSVPAAVAPRGDALITGAPGLLLAVGTADCVPILLADPRTRAVAAVHAGWRGTLKRIAAKTIGRMQMGCGTRPADVLAVLGPAIGACCYEVGPDVVRAFAAQFADAADWFDPVVAGPHGKTMTFEMIASGEAPNPMKWLWRTPPGHDPPPPALMLNLAAANRSQLAAAGVPAANIVASPLCTACRTDLLFSYRRERPHTGRLLGAIGLRG